MIPPETIQQVAEATDIVKLIGRDVALKKTGATYTGLCFSHPEKTPSLVVTPARQRFKCFGCGVTGDAFDYGCLAWGLPFVDIRSTASTDGALGCTRPIRA